MRKRGAAVDTGVTVFLKIAGIPDCTHVPRDVGLTEEGSIGVVALIAFVEAILGERIAVFETERQDSRCGNDAREVIRATILRRFTTLRYRPLAKGDAAPHPRLGVEVPTHRARLA